MTNAFYITTPIYYVNAKPHLGHTYTTIVADVACRFHSMLNEETYFLTGTDEHGDKIVEAAKKENLNPKAYVDGISKLFHDLWPQLNIKFNRFIRTTDTDHIQLVKQILQKIYDSGDIYFSEYEGLYCFGCERFYTDRELINGKCPDHEVAPEPIKESNYFFKMSRYQDWLIDLINSNPDLIQPQRYRNEILAFLREPLEDLCISRPKTRLEWGISLPFDDNYVTYVWFDALINYLSGISFPEGDTFNKFWPEVRHIVAKDILKPHGIYWPIMLKAAGINIYKHLYVHGYWNIDESKMSKSIVNVVDPVYLLSTYGTDATRYFLIREMVFGLDSNFSEKAIIQRINSDLANDIGNLFSRVLAMVHKYFNGIVPQNHTKIHNGSDSDLREEAKRAIHGFEKSMRSFEFHKSIIAIWEYISTMNKYVDTTAPWELAKKEETKTQLESVMYNLLEGLRVVAGLIYPIMPGTSQIMLSHLCPDKKDSLYSLEEIGCWGTIPTGSRILKPVKLFPRIETKNHLDKKQKKKKSKKKNTSKTKTEISIEDVAKLDLRVAKITSAERINNTEKLLKLEVDIGSEKKTIVAGIAKSYSTQEIIGKEIIIITNLKPATLMNVQSEGMLLAAIDNNVTALITPDKSVPPGSPVR